mmetsp:Transcript_41644/g.87362  ORF Transcript_41644/g.87362 Transcript_41644/m.87362 type:complete len:103 (-) Transcript_41644:233-541(-)
MASDVVDDVAVDDVDIEVADCYCWRTEEALAEVDVVDAVDVEDEVDEMDGSYIEIESGTTAVEDLGDDTSCTKVPNQHGNRTMRRMDDCVDYSGCGRCGHRC